MNTPNLKPTFDTESVRVLLDLPTLQDVKNLTRRGKALHGALVGRGRFDVNKVRRVRAQMIRRRLARALGRSNPRFVPDDHSRECKECKGIAVEWEGAILCENGHRVAQEVEK